MTANTEGPPGVVETITVPIGQLKPHRKNPRRGDVELIKESLRAHGQYRAIVARKATNEVLAGNHTLRAARELGWETILVHLVDVTPEQAKRILLVDNRANDQAGYDNDALAELLASLPSLDATGWTQSSYDALVSRVAGKLPDPAPVELEHRYEIIVECDSEEQQRELLDRLIEEGNRCRALTS